MCIYPKKLTINNISINKNIPIYVENEIQKNHEKYYDYKKHLYSLIIRVSYGGMKCDMQMILSFLWSYFQNKDLINYVKIKPIKIKFYELVKSDILLESIDFHCCNQLLEFLSKKYEFNTKQLKDAIWYNSSSINTRETNELDNKFLINIWEEIKYDVRNFNDKYIEKYLKFF